jgi:hypothetical protein
LTLYADSSVLDSSPILGWRRTNQGDLEIACEVTLEARIVVVVKRLVTVSILLTIVTLLMPQTALAQEVQFGNVKVSLPDEITVTGSESGTEARKCSIKVTLDADAGTTIPLRGSVTMILRDSLGTTFDQGDAIALVEGMTRLELRGAFSCDANRGTLKPPYTFVLINRVTPSSTSVTIPVKLTFVESAARATPTPTMSSNPKIRDNEAVALAQNSELKARLTQLESQLKTIQSALLKANQKLTKICATKPKPKGC